MYGQNNENINEIISEEVINAILKQQNKTITFLVMREIKHIVIHCTATEQTATVEAIKNHWKNTLKWNNPGYHYLIEKNGTIHNLQPPHLPTNGVAGHNKNSLHISYIGGINGTGKPVDNRTPEQIKSMITLILLSQNNYPTAKICGHRDFEGVTKACPSFDVKQWLTFVGIKNN